MRLRAVFASSALIVLFAAACAEETAQQAGKAPAAAGAAPAAHPPPLNASEPTAPENPAIAPLTAEGWGPLRIGMTRVQITAVLGPDANPGAVGGADPAQCDQFRPSRAPEGMLVMVESGRLSRISLINNSSVTTDQGIAIGATPAAVLSAYGTAIRAEPHKYESPPAQYLTAWGRGGGAESGSRGIRYEVNGTGRVAMIHAGGPSIAYVEGCA